MKRLSYLLRHTVCSEMDEAGWMAVSDVARILNTTEINILDVATNDKKNRYEISYEPIQKIRARHGHSIVLSQPGWMNRPVTIDDFDHNLRVMHTTTHENWELIKADGFLKPMGRQVIHFAVNEKLLRSRPVTICVDMQKALHDKIPFFWSTNEILVCPVHVPISLVYVLAS